MKIISGGQTGVDRAALETARAHGVETGGFAPLGWITEDGPDPSLADFGLLQIPNQDYPSRTKANVETSHGTVWFGNKMSRGFMCTENACMKFRRPLLVNPHMWGLVQFIRGNNFTIVNVAGTRASRDTDGAAAGLCQSVLGAALDELGYKEEKR